jgi:GNAT superfamily N-acetyltransferase
MPDVIVRVAGAADRAALVKLRSIWTAPDADDEAFQSRMAAWLAAEGERRTTWIATSDDQPVGMASLFEYRRMPRPGRPDSRWGYVSNMFVLEEYRNRGIGLTLLAALIAAADERRYARLVLSPSRAAMSFYQRAGFKVPDERVGDDRLLVRLSRPG